MVDRAITVSLSSKHPHTTIRKQIINSFESNGVDILILCCLWAASIVIDRSWLAIDQSIPSWDPADHLIGSLNYWWMVHHADIFSGEWWRGIWTLSSKYPPLLYLSTAPFVYLFGKTADAAIWVNALYTAILLMAVYGLGRRLFNPTVGLWAAGLCVLFPQFYTLRSDYYMDYPLTALVAAAFCLLTYWKDCPTTKQQWFWAIAFGLVFGCASLMKQTAVMFLGIPLLWLGGRSLWEKKWNRFSQLIVACSITGLMMLPWSRTNWLFQISAAFSSNTRSAAIEGDPSGLSIEGWTYYLSRLPQVISYPLLVVAVCGLILWACRISPLYFSANSSFQSTQTRPLSSSVCWLAMFIIGAYGIWSAIANKDIRYIMPYLPIIAVLLGAGMASWRGRWKIIPWFAVGLSLALMVTNLFSPVSAQPSRIAKVLTPGGQHPVYVGEVYPHREVIAEMINTQPYQLMNLGVLPSTPEINQHNLNYIGTQSDFQVYARRMGKSKEHIDQDLRSMSWFVTVTRPQLNHHNRKSRRRQLDISKDLRRSPYFQIQRSWNLPDGSRLDLFRRKELPVEVKLLTTSLTPSTTDEEIQLKEITVPARTSQNQRIPVTYRWEGPWDRLTNGVVLLTWQRQDNHLIKPLDASSKRHVHEWIHDHRIGTGTLRPLPIQANQSVLSPSPAIASNELAKAFEVTERMAMHIPDTIQPGRYVLKVEYLDTTTGKVTTIDTPDVSIKVRAARPEFDDEKRKRQNSTPEVDWVSQLRTLSRALPEGPDALGPVFDQIGRFSLYDPIQSYAVQAETTLRYRLQQDPTILDDAYALALAQVLQRDAAGAIATLNHIIELDAGNPYAYGYLAFVNLYAWHPRAAQNAINQAIALSPDSEEFKMMRLVASLMGGNFWQAWKDGQTLLTVRPLSQELES